MFHKYHDTDKPRGTQLFRYAFQLLQQLVQIVPITGANSRISGGNNAGSAVQGINHQA